jgi:adenylate cyclase
MSESPTPADDATWRELIDRGVYDPSSAIAGQRRELLEHLLDGGASVDEIVRAFWENRVDTTNSYRFLRGPDPWIDAATVAARSNSTVERVERMVAALGLPVAPAGEAAYAPTLVVCAEAFETGLAIFGEAATLQFIRVLGSSMTAIAEAGIALFVHEVMEGSPPVTELERTKSGEEATVAAMLIPEIVAATWTSVFLQANDRDIAQRRETPTGMAQDVAIGFVDLVGFTALSQRRTMSEVADVLVRFETTAWDLAAAHHARVTKFVGDEAMIVGADPVGVVEIALGLCAMAEADPDLESARGAVTYGLVHHRNGDYFGPLVNLAARAVSVAKPGTVLVPDAVRQRLGPSPSLTATAVGTFDLRGFTEPIELWQASTTAR